MALKAKVKVGHITNLSEARYCAGMGVDLLGFPVGENALSPERYKQMIEWVAGPEFVLEVHRLPNADLNYITDNYPGHYIEINSSQLDWLSRTDVNFIVALKKGETVPYRENIKFVEIHDWNNGATGFEYPVLINIGSVDELGDVLRAGKGVALNGSDEEKPGIKDYSVLAEVLEALEME